MTPENGNDRTMSLDLLATARTLFDIGMCTADPKEQATALTAVLTAAVIAIAQAAERGADALEDMAAALLDVTEGGALKINDGKP